MEDFREAMRPCFGLSLTHLASPVAYLFRVGDTWLRLSALGEQFYRENWQRYRELYPEVGASVPDA